MSDVQRFVVRNDALVSRAIVGDDDWKGTTDVVLHADYLSALAQRDADHAAALGAQRDTALREALAAVEALMSPPSDQDPTPLDFAIYEEVLPRIQRLIDKGDQT